MTQTINPTDKVVIGMMLVEAMSGEIDPRTHNLINAMDAAIVPQPFRHILRYVQGYMLEDNKRLALDLVEEIRGICVEIQQDAAAIK